MGKWNLYALLSIHYSAIPAPGISYDWSILTHDVMHVNRDFKIQRHDSNENVKMKLKMKERNSLFKRRSRCRYVVGS